jgi:hypothetical protein
MIQFRGWLLVVAPPRAHDCNRSNGSDEDREHAGADLCPNAPAGAAAIASAVPVYNLSIVRDLDRLPQVVDSIVEWHGLPESEIDDPV